MSKRESNPEPTPKSHLSNRLPDLGDRVRHKITGFEGVIATHAAHIAGCDQMWALPKVDRDGKNMDGAWVDIDLLEIIEANAVDVVQYDRKAPGGIDLPAPR